MLSVMSEALCVTHRGYDHGKSLLSLELFDRANLHPVHAQPVNQQTNLLHLLHNHTS